MEMSFDWSDMRLVNGLVNRVLLMIFFFLHFSFCFIFNLAFMGIAVTYYVITYII